MIIVTGANGFIGSALVWELNQAGHKDIVCVDTISLEQRSDPLKKSTFSQFLGKDQIWSFLQTTEAIKSVTAILHIGACSSTTEMNVAFLNENNVEYTRRLWKWCTEYRKTYIYASSAAVYGDGSRGFDDALPTDTFTPLNPYGESKAAFDRWAEVQSDTPPVWMGLRFFNVFGPNEYHKGFMSSVPLKAFGQISETGRLSLFRSHNPTYNDGEQMRDFVYVKDITRWILELMNRTGLRSGIYNMGYGQARTWLDLAHSVFKTMNKPVQIDWIDIPEAMRTRYQYFTEAKMDRLFALGVSRSAWPLEKAIEDYVRNYLQPGYSASGNIVIPKDRPLISAYL
jgi:ADP-L-glycero-D-manno-heptose 6-epimerase